MHQATFNLHQIVLYRHLLNDPVIQDLQQILQQVQENDPHAQLRLEGLYTDFLYRLLDQAETQKISGSLWKNYVAHFMIADENVFSLSCEKHGTAVSKNLMEIASRDLVLLQALYDFDWEPLNEYFGFGRILGSEYMCSSENTDVEMSYPRKLLQMKEILSGKVPIQDKISLLISFYHEKGCGQMAQYVAFRWDDGLQGIPQPDAVSFNDLVGYTYQKKILIENTRFFVKGKKANNILLYGEKGTGKSSSVKALLDAFSAQGLRMIELSKAQLSDFSRIVQSIRERTHRFIIFIDDLSFEDFEVDYKYLKANLEGSLETRADNVLVYVTSNRRHLIKESWSDRKGSNDEVHVADTQQEKLSFADRFGISIQYYSPNQEQYLEIVNELAKKNGLEMPVEELRKLAIQWELNHNGRSGRTAQQFITYLCGKG